MPVRGLELMEYQRAIQPPMAPLPGENQFFLDEAVTGDEDLIVAV
jgi:hypothetical protein